MHKQHKQNEWSDLTMRERSQLIRLAVTNGMVDLSHIKSAYNEFATGGFTDALSQQDSLKHEQLYRSVNPAWAVPNPIQGLRAYKVVSEARHNNKDINSGTPEDNAFLRKYLKLPHDTSLTPQSQHTPTVTKGSLPSAYVGINTSIKEGLLQQLDTTALRYKIEDTDRLLQHLPYNSPEYNEVHAQKRRIEKGYSKVKKLLDGEAKDNKVNVKDIYHPQGYTDNHNLYRNPLSPLGGYQLSMPKDKSYIAVYDKYDFPWYAQAVLPSKSKVDEFEIYDRISKEELEERIKRTQKERQSSND